MKASEDLHKLIHSLSKAEKRNFRLFASKYDFAGKSNYIKLFDAIEKQETYNEAELKLHFRKETFIKHLPSEKNYLYNFLLDSLHALHAEEDVAGKLKKRLQQAVILNNRGLTEQGSKILKKVKETAQQNELYQVLLDALQLEKQIITRNYYTGITQSALDSIYTEEKKCIAVIAETNEYWRLFSDFYKFHYGKGSGRDAAEWEKIKALFRHPLLSDISRATTFQARIDFLHIHALYHFMAGNAAQAYIFNRQQLALLESDPTRLKRHLKRYMATLNNSLMDGLGLGKYDEVIAGIEKLRRLPLQYSTTVTDTQRADIFRLSSILELNIAIKRGRFADEQEKAEIIVKQLQTYEAQIVKHNRLTLYYLLAYVFFGSKRYKEAIKLLNNIINDTDDGVLQDIHAFARIFGLIIHYELDNFDLIEHLHQSISRYLNRRSKVYKAEDILLKGLKKLAALQHNQREKQKILNQMHASLLPLKSDPLEGKAFEYFDLLSWVESKIAKNDFAYIIQAKNASATAG